MKSFIITLLCLYLSSCHLWPFSKKSKSDSARFAASDTKNLPEESKGIDRESINIKRSESRSQFSIQFKTMLPSRCKIFYWNQEQGFIKDDAAKELPCQESSAISFFETIEDIRQDSLYLIQIETFTKENLDEVSDSIAYVENPTSAGDVVELSDLRGLSQADWIQEITAIQNIFPLSSAEVTQKKLTPPLSLAAFKQSIAQRQNCKIEDISSAGTPKIWLVDKDLNLEYINTKGYTSASSVAHPHEKNRLKLNFKFVQSGLPWLWIYKENGSEGQFSTKGAARLKQVDIVWGSTVSLKNPSIKEDDFSTIPADDDKNLKIEWSYTAENPFTEYSTILIKAASLNNPTQELSCRLSLQDNTVEIDKSLMRQLGDGEIHLEVIMENRELNIFPGEERNPWLLTTYDWRVAKITH